MCVYACECVCACVYVGRGLQCREGGDTLTPPIVVVRFEFVRHARKVRLWLLGEGLEAEICRCAPGFGDDLVVSIDDPLAFARWHMGRIEWAAALRGGGITVA